MLRPKYILWGVLPSAKHPEGGGPRCARQARQRLAKPVKPFARLACSHRTLCSVPPVQGARAAQREPPGYAGLTTGGHQRCLKFSCVCSRSRARSVRISRPGRLGEREPWRDALCEQASRAKGSGFFTAR